MGDHPTSEPPDEELLREAQQRAARWVDAPTNPRTWPSRPRTLVQADVERSHAERAGLAEMITGAGQDEALAVPALEAVSLPGGTSCSTITWVEGRIHVLERADAVTLVSLPRTIDGSPSSVSVRWDVAARVCAACWQPIRDLPLDRLVTRRWPDAHELAAIEALALPLLPTPD
jgi:hypothetical protein